MSVPSCIRSTTGMVRRRCNASTIHQLNVCTSQPRFRSLALTTAWRELPQNTTKRGRATDHRFRKATPEFAGSRKMATFTETRKVLIGYDQSNDDISQVSARLRFKEIPVHPTILKNIRKVGVGREGKESRRKKRPFEKKRQKSNLYLGTETMTREEERRFLQKASDRSSGRNRRTHVQNLGHRHEMLLPPPPFGEGQRQRGSTELSTTQSVTKSIRLLPVKVLGRVTSSLVADSDKTEAGDRFPRPSAGLPEVAIIGRSNVGKSTLLNALLYAGRNKEQMNATPSQTRRRRSNIVPSQTARLPKGLKAKTSSKPGETRSIDFYQLSAEVEESYISRKEDGQNQPTNEGSSKKIKKKTSLILVDLPGYGFAFGPKKERKEAMAKGGDGRTRPDFMFPWQSLIETYIISRPRSSLKRILLLIDARHGMKQADAQFLASLQRALLQEKREASSFDTRELQRPRVPTELPPLQIVLTKCDLVSQVDLARRVVQVRQQLSDCLLRQPKYLPEMLVSAQIEGQAGVFELQKELASLCDQNRSHLNR